MFGFMQSLNVSVIVPSHWYCAGLGQVRCAPPCGQCHGRCVPVLRIRAAALLCTVTEQQAQGEAAAGFVCLLRQMSKRKGACK